MSLFLPIRAFNRSQKVRIGGQTILPTITSYIDLLNGSTHKEFTSHSAIGAVYPVGPLTASNSDVVVISGGVVTAGNALNFNVTAGEFKTRSTGAFVAGLVGTNVALTTAHGTLDRTDLVVWDTTSGVASKVDGTTAAAGTSVAPATPAGKVALATILVAATVTVPGTITDVRPRP